MKNLCVGVCLVFALSPFVRAGDAEKDMKAFQGKWEGKIDGEKEEVELVIVKDQWTLQDKNKKGLFFKGTFTLNVKGKQAAMDMKVTETGEMLEKFKDKTALAIYELSGDTLKWCANEPGNADRPTEFTNKGDKIFVTFTRAK